ARDGGAGARQAATSTPTSFLGVVWDSLSGDVYAPGRWKPLPFATFFSEGWDEPWAGGPNGQGGDGAPRQGWLNAQDGVFYRLGILTFNYQHNVGNGDNWTSALSIYTPFNRPSEVRWDIPLILSNKATRPSTSSRVPTFRSCRASRSPRRRTRHSRSTSPSVCRPATSSTTRARPR